MKIKTNGVPRHIIGWSDLTEREKCEHDYMLSKAHQESHNSSDIKECVFDSGFRICF